MPRYSPTPSQGGGAASRRNGGNLEVHDESTAHTNDTVNSNSRRGSPSRYPRHEGDQSRYKTSRDCHGDQSHDRNHHRHGQRGHSERYGEHREPRKFVRKRSPSPYRARRSRSRSPYRPASQSVGDTQRYNTASRTSNLHNYSNKLSQDGRASLGGDTSRSYKSSSKMDERESRGARDRSRSPLRSPSVRQPPPVQQNSKSSLKNEGNDTGRDGLSAMQLESSRNALHIQNEAKPQLSAHSDDTAVEESETSLKRPLSDAELIEERRKKRAAIRAKFNVGAEASAASDQDVSASDMNLPDVDDGRVVQRAINAVNDSDHAAGSAISPQSAKDASVQPTNAVNAIEKQLRPMSTSLAQAPVAEPEQEPAQTTSQQADFDMFADELGDEDMFANVGRGAAAPQIIDKFEMDDSEMAGGHYRVKVNELLDGRYIVTEELGKGSFATVVRALDQTTMQTVAVKIAAKNDVMLLAARKEMKTLKLLNGADEQDQKHVIRFIRDFMHQGHLCLVFENLSLDLRRLLKREGRRIGLLLRGIRSYAQQMFIALDFMRQNEVVHADLKPDNILVNGIPHNLIKVCDFGTALLVPDILTGMPNLMSRFYRPPEVILGMPFGCAIDMWSIGCTLFELYSDQILFTGATNNDMLLKIQAMRGKVPKRMIKKAEPRDEHFDEYFDFYSTTVDQETGAVKAVLVNIKAHGGGDLKSRLNASVPNGISSLSSEEMDLHTKFYNLLDSCLQIDPDRRLTPVDALRHPFFAKGKVAGASADVPSNSATKSGVGKV